ELLGIKDNRSFLEAILRQPCFIDGHATTRFLTEQTLTFNQPPEAHHWAVAAVVQQQPSANLLASQAPHPVHLHHGDSHKIITLQRKQHEWIATVDEKRFTLQRQGNQIHVDGYRQPFYWHLAEDTIALGLGSQHWLFSDTTYAAANSADAVGNGNI